MTPDCCSGCVISLINIVILTVVETLQLDSKISAISTYNVAIPTGAYYIG